MLTFIIVRAVLRHINSKKFLPVFKLNALWYRKNINTFLRTRAGEKQWAQNATMLGKYLTPTAIPRCYLRFAAVLAMCFTIVAHISAMDEVSEGPRRGEVQNSDQASANGADFAGKQTSLHRERRSVYKNATASSLSAVEKRLQAMEER